MQKSWFKIKKVREIDSPALAIFMDRVQANIERMIDIAGSPGRLQPHVKTYKIAGIVKMQMKAGIKKFKCATIAEAEMLGIAGAPSALLAYQPSGPKMDRILRLVKKYPKTKYSVLLDNGDTAAQLSFKCEDKKRPLDVLIDINNGNNRTGIIPENAPDLIRYCDGLPGINLIGLHVYDGHIHRPDPVERKDICLRDFKKVTDILDQLEPSLKEKLIVIVGGSPTFPIHAQNERVICSPGTTLLWDAGYGEKFKDMPFEPAAVLITRVISKPAEGLLCLDLGHKSVAAENPLENRVRFLNADGLVPVSQSEEHLVVKNTLNNDLDVGDVLYAIPYHICPTTALYDEVMVIKDHKLKGTWEVMARGRKILV